MKKYVKYGYLLCSIFIYLIGFCSGYEQQGFSQYQEGLDGVFFNCESRCTITLGQKDKIDYLLLSGTVNGSGIIGIYKGDILDLFFKQRIITSSNLSRFPFFEHKIITSSDFSIFVDLAEYKQELWTSSGNLSLLINGNISGNIYLETGALSFLQKINLVWNDFWSMEGYRQNSVNFREGVSIRGTSIVKYGYIAFIIIFLTIFLFKKGKIKIKLLFYVGLGLFFLIGIRNTITYTVYLYDGLYEFKSDKIYFELGDFFSFVEKVRNKLELDSDIVSNCKFLFEQTPEIPKSPLYIFLKPCERVLTGDLADYKIYYQKEIPEEDLDKKVLLDFNGSYLLENKSK